MIRQCFAMILLAAGAAVAGCRACDTCYEEGPIIGSPQCGIRSGSILAYPNDADGTYMSAPTPANAPRPMAPRMTSAPAR